jgi:hypothetical protein
VVLSVRCGVQEILSLKLFEPKQVQQARRTQAIKRTGMLPSRQSERRGAEAPGAGTTIVASLDEA